MALFSIFMLPMLGSLLLIPPLMRLAVHLQVVDIPDERKVHTGSIPRIGGVAMIIGTLVAIGFFLEIDQQILAFIIATLCLAGFGVWDDRLQLGYRIKFIGQLLASFIVIVFADIKIDSMQFLYTGIIPDVYAIPFTVFVLLGAMNAINLSDGLDGLAGGGSLLSLGVIAILGYQTGDFEFVMLTLAVMGSVFGFLRFNTHPAVVFMGDTGSQFLGFSIGVLAIILTQDINPVLSPSIGMVILGLPILDTFTVICHRLVTGKSPFKPDKNHIHHKLLNIGLDHYAVVFVIYLIQSAMVVAAYYFRYHPDVWILFYYVLFGVVLFLSLYFYKPQLNSSKNEHLSFFSRLIGQQGNQRAVLVFIICLAILVCMPAFVIWVVFHVNNIPGVLSIVSFITAMVVLSYGFFLPNTRTELPLRLALYIISTLSVYLVYNNLDVYQQTHEILNPVFMVLGLMVIIGLMMPDQGKISVTPLDYIIIFVVISFTVFSSQQSQQAGAFAILMAWLFVLFYASEYLLMSIKKHQYLIKTMLILSLSAILARALML